MAMARLQEYFEPSEHGISTPLPRSRFLYDLGSSLAVHSEASMAHPLLQSPLRPQNHMPQSQWTMPQSSVSRNSMAACPLLWESHSTSPADNVTWTQLPSEALVDDSILTNENLLYSHDARHNTMDKCMAFKTPSFWPSGGMSDMVPSPCAEALLSPTSPFSDAKNSYSPGSDHSPMTPVRDFASFPMASGVAKVSASPSMVPPTPQSVIRQQPGSSTTRREFQMPVAPAGYNYLGNTREQNDDMSMYGSEHSYGQSQSSSPGTAQWLPPGYRIGKDAVAQDFLQHRFKTPQIDRRPNSFLASLERNSRQRQAQWSNTDQIPAQSHFQTRFMTPLTDGEKAQRAKDDETLLRMKRDGYTYRDIRKALDRRVAESTLRGRYRSLTKPRKERVRSPKWTEVDVDLLKRYVQEEFKRLDVTQPSLETKQKSDKVPWMKIVELIASTGGSYKFGAATAKKKWLEVTRSTSTRSLRRRNQA